MSKTWGKAGGSYRVWRKRRAWILAENQRTNRGRCTLLIPKICTGQAQCVHHVMGRGITGDDPKYLVPACTACNLHIGQPSHGTQPRPTSKW